MVCRLDAVRIAFKQASAHRLLQSRNRSGNRGLRGVQNFRGPAHTAGLNDRYEESQVAEL